MGGLRTESFVLRTNGCSEDARRQRFAISMNFTNFGTAATDEGGDATLTTATGHDNETCTGFTDIHRLLDTRILFY